MDADGLRETIYLGNERAGGCPFRCKGCGVHDNFKLVTKAENRRIILSEINALILRRKNFLQKYKKNKCHVIVYNSGNVTSFEELSKANFVYLLKSLKKLSPVPQIVALNSRGGFVNDNLLQLLSDLDLPYRVDFDIGVESLTKRGMNIYGKNNIDKEFARMFNIIKNYNFKNAERFGIMANFVYLPEAYLNENESRKGNLKKIRVGFVNEIISFAKNYSNRGVPLRINLHPFYFVKGLPYEDSNLDDFMGAMKVINIKLDKMNESIKKGPMKVSVFIGIQGRAYKRDNWTKQIKKWGGKIKLLNKSLLDCSEQTA